MTRYNPQALNELPFSEVVERFSTITHKGANDFTLCPWHEDKHPSLLIGGSNHPHRCKCFACGKGGSVIDYVMQKNGWDFKEACEKLSRDFNIPMIEDERAFVKREQKKAEKKTMDFKKIAGIINRFLPSKSPVTLALNGERVGVRGFVYVPWEVVSKHESSSNTFCDCLRSMYMAEGIEYAVQLYHLGTWELNGVGGFVMFPSIDTEGRIHNIKIQRYCTIKSSPQFFHKEENTTFWLGTMLQKEGIVPQGELDSSCFFGEHLLAQFPNSPVVLVESPKNAVVGCLANTSFVWIAAGNKGNLTRKKLECLRGRKVIVVPDKDAIEDWKRLLSKMTDIATFEFSSFCEAVLMKMDSKSDLADYLIDKLRII